MAAEPNRKNLTHDQKRALGILERTGRVMLHDRPGAPESGCARKRTLNTLVARGLGQWGTVSLWASYGTADWPAVVKLSPIKTPVTIRQSDMSDFGWTKDVVLVAFDGGSAVGVLHVSPEPEYTVIQHLFVRRPYRRQGVARQLVDEAKRRLEKPVAHDNRLSLDGGQFARTLGLTKLRYPFQRLNAERTETTGDNLLINASGVLISEGESEHDTAG